MQDFLFYLILGLALSSLSFYLNKGTSKTIIQDDEGFTTLKMHKLYGIGGLLGIIGGFIFFIAIFFVDDLDVVAIALILLVGVGFFWVLGIASLLWYKNHSLKFNESTIEVVNVYGKRSKIYWKEIAFMKFKPFLSVLVIQDETNQKISIHQHLVGLSSFTSMIDLKTTYNTADLGIPISEPIIKGF